MNTTSQKMYACIGLALIGAGASFMVKALFPAGGEEAVRVIPIMVGGMFFVMLGR